MYLGTEHWIYF